MKGKQREVPLMARGFQGGAKGYFSKQNKGEEEA